MTLTPFLLAGSFFLGSLPFSYWLTRWAVSADLRDFGSGNPGATNVLRVGGRLPAAAALVLDVLKGAVAVVLGLRLAEASWIVAAMAVAAVSGHVFSPWLGFRGGKGVATSMGARAMLNPPATFGGILVLLTVVTWKRYVSLGSMMAFPTIVLLWPLGDDWVGGEGIGSSALIGAIAITAIVLVRHSSNIKRLRAGQESKLGERVN
jgi:glycerol-3-phosphate acyltransferase PlsY